MTTIPRRFAVNDSSYCKKEVQAAFCQDGAVILTHLVEEEDDHADDDNDNSSRSSWANVAASVPHLIWASEHDLLLQTHRADAVHKEHEALNLSGQALLPHTDGYIWGDGYPDVVILVCQQPAQKEHGANFLMDGKNVVARLKDTTRDFLEKTLVDHTERGESSFAQGAKSIVPVLRWLEPKAWRRELSLGGEAEEKQLCWRRMIGKQYAGYTEDDDGAVVETETPPYISLWTAPAGASADTTRMIDEALYELDRAIAKEAREAVRFCLKSGEALVVDNFRMLHAREAFEVEDERRMWRVWSWTSASMGLPPEMAAANESKDPVAANLLEAELAIQANGKR